MVPPDAAISTAVLLNMMFFAAIHVGGTVKIAKEG
jgi:hypothetical protein